MVIKPDVVDPEGVGGLRKTGIVEMADVTILPYIPGAPDHIEVHLPAVVEDVEGEGERVPVAGDFKDGPPVFRIGQAHGRIPIDIHVSALHLGNGDEGVAVDHGVVVEVEVAHMYFRLQYIVGGIVDDVAVDLPVGAGQQVGAAIVDGATA